MTAVGRILLSLAMQDFPSSLSLSSSSLFISDKLLPTSTVLPNGDRINLKGLSLLMKKRQSCSTVVYEKGDMKI